MNVCSNFLSRRLPFFYGYLMIPVVMLMQITSSPGQTFAFSAFAPSFHAAFEMSHRQLTSAYMLGTVLAAIPLLMIGSWSDRIGLRALTIVVMSSVATACYFAAEVTGWWSLLGIFFLLRFLGQGALSLLSGNAIAMWFRSRVGRVSAIMSIGTAIAFAWLPGWISTSIAHFGWRETYRWIALIILVAVVPVVVVLFRDRPEDLGQEVDGIKWETETETSQDMEERGGGGEINATLRDAIRTRAYWILGFVNAAWAMIGTGVVFYLYIICEQRGLSEQVPNSLFKTFGMAMLVGQLGGGFAADFMKIHRIFGVGTVMLCAGTGAILLGKTPLMLHGFSGLFGFGQGLLLAVGAVVWVRYYGRTHLGAIRGSVWCATVAGSGCGPLLMGLSQDHFGRFDPAIMVFFLLLAVLSVAAWFTTAPPIAQPAGNGGS